MAGAYLVSDTDPLRIPEPPAETAGGLPAITFVSGKRQTGALGSMRRRDLLANRDLIAASSAAAVVTLVEVGEIEALGHGPLGAEVRRRHMERHHWPIRDYGVPDAAFEAAWPARSAELRSLLARGGCVLIHCKGGLGRAGMIGARLLVEAGCVEPGAAVAVMRAVRPGAVETKAQKRWVLAGRTAPLPGPGRGRGEPSGMEDGGRMPDEALVGIFWFVRGDDGELAMPMRACPLGEAEEYGDCLTFGAGHHGIWGAWRAGRLRLDAASPALRRAVSLSEYEDWPRGRVVHERAPSPRFVVYADRQAFTHRDQIVGAFRLPPELTRMRTDAHYRSTRRIARGPEDAA